MKNQTHIERLNNLLDFINERFKENITSKDLEEVAFYSYRNINRIFSAVHHETIGQYIKRLKLEKAAEYIKFSDENITEIAFELGFADLASFTKAFKNKFNTSPTAYRNAQKTQEEITFKAIKNDYSESGLKIDFEVVTLPEMKVLYLTHYGSYSNVAAINKTWDSLAWYAYKKKLLKKKTLFIGEVLDDNEITDESKCRYNATITLEKPIDFKLKGFFKTKTIASKKYAKFLHHGSHDSMDDTYDLIYSQWILNNDFELADEPLLEVYANDELITPKEQLISEIYIPIL